MTVAPAASVMMPVVHASAAQVIESAETAVRRRLTLLFAAVANPVARTMSPSLKPSVMNEPDDLVITFVVALMPIVMTAPVVAPAAQAARSSAANRSLWPPICNSWLSANGAWRRPCLGFEYC